IVMPYISSIASIGSLYVFRRILFLLHRDDQYFIGLTAVFMGLSVFALTESFSLLFVLCGIYFALFRNSTRRAGLSIMFFLFASYLREPYLMFLFGNFVYMLMKTENRKALLVYFLGL